MQGQVFVGRERELKELKGYLDKASSGPGRAAEGRELLAECYGWFTEGFDTPDLQEAEELLKELAQ